jgi:wyosine [tRNA(Phe)-imidazoG37] synthetase (radical SAM superfamily)
MKSKTIYGPVKARRLGEWNGQILDSCADSLGINLSTYPVCSFDCVYCSCGKTQNLTTSPSNGDYVEPTSFEKDLREGFEQHRDMETPIDYISFVGWTEPTLHPNFPEIVQIFKKVKEKYFPNKPTAIFSNSTTLGDANVRNALRYFDRTFFKLDTSSNEAFKRVNHPAEGITLDEIVDNLVLASSEGIPIELSAMILRTNYRDLCSEEYLESVRKIKPKDERLYLCTPDWLVPTKNGGTSLMPPEEDIQKVVEFLFKSEFTPVLLPPKRGGLHPLVSKR